MKGIEITEISSSNIFMALNTSKDSSRTVSSRIKQPSRKMEVEQALKEISDEKQKLKQFKD